MVQAGPPTHLGRYKIGKMLEAAGHGAAYLAADPQSQLPVLVKQAFDQAPRKNITQAPLADLLVHANIVPIREAFEQAGQRWVVFEYIEGTGLDALLAEGKPLDTALAARIALQMLDGLVYAHDKGVAHRGLAAESVLFDQQNRVRIMDFGLFPWQVEESGQLQRDKHGDLFAVAQLLYRMLTGKALPEGGDAAPSAHNAAVNAELDAIVQRALGRAGLARFVSAEQFYAALKHYLVPEGGGEVEAESKQRILDALLQRMRLKSDFPALSQAVVAINKIADADTESLHSLTEIILKDFSLTNKLLRLANSASFGQYGGTISTISSAVIILGFEAVRNLAITLILFEYLHNKSQARQLRDEVIRTFLNGLIARQIDKRRGARNLEESFICGMFHNLGRLLTTFYLFDDAMEIRQRVQAGPLSEELTEVAVLGLSYTELGMGVARLWNFPAKLVESMQPLPLERLRKPQGATEWMRLVSGLSHALTRGATDAPGCEKNHYLADLSKRYQAAVSLGERDLSRIVDEALGEFLKEAALFGINPGQSEALRNARIWAGQGVGEEDAGAAVLDPLEQKIEETQATAAAAARLQEQDAQAVLSTGIQDITNVLVSEYSLNELLRAILETMYRGIGFDRVLLCMRDLKSRSLPARLGFGAESASLIKRFVVPDAASQDVFQVALDKQADIFLTDINANNIRARVPAWYRNMVQAETFILLPVVVDKKIVGLFYGDKMKAGELNIPPKALSLLKTLRNQAVLAIRQKRLG